MSGQDLRPKQCVISDKEFERHFSLQNALVEFTKLYENQTSETAIAIVGATFLDTMLEHILMNFLVDDEQAVQRVLAYDQPLGTYSGRTNMAYCLGLIGKTIRDDLRLVGKIRNRFAHDLHASFHEDPIRAWCLALKWHEVSMFMKPPEGASPQDIFQVGLHQLISHLNGIVSIAGTEKRTIPEHR